MVFASLSGHEKQAFFSLLDEYFEARPELLSGAGGGSGISTGAAASAVSHALSSNPSIAAPRATPFAAAASNPQLASSIGKVAAASRNFGNNASSASESAMSPPPVLPRRASSTSVNSTSLGSTPAERASPSPSAGTPGAEIDKLYTRKASLFGKNKTPSVAVTIPPAFNAPKSNFGPPPMRRNTSTTSADVSPSPAPPPSLPRRTPSVQPESDPEPQEEEAQGDWAEALYDYESTDAGDLPIREGQNIWVTEKSSEDWWTGQIEGKGKEGLFPASYVKVM
ncbi:hypothetical protein CONPUDRAFT_136717 [Coniophora puteana RWD-64-598 SS2]|uniref:SH3 domain-containing protein n=1 Tax=Coniophora puteana (strain RWD-64-598) TaxID=741705 RepID=A0A5M3MU00_CONPW|nr:uncharacterized protein CONPUDRAFT_136717 [Coniophora puteana RWD-64-598 SS2]EIW82165.1 hypothetical protein CONPUDRAFT_136717 [Coniophora puteana RWD-64-598 SS2]